jgi:hypothetical protein
MGDTAAEGSCAISTGLAVVCSVALRVQKIDPLECNESRAHDGHRRRSRPCSFASYLVVGNIRAEFPPVFVLIKTQLEMSRQSSTADGGASGAPRNWKEAV